MTASQDQDTAQSGPLSADAELVFVDCEMTGGNIDKNEIIEIGAVRVQLPRLAEAAELHVRVTPRTMRGSNRDSIRIAGYDPKKWKNSVDLAVALDQLAEISR